MTTSLRYRFFQPGRAAFALASALAALSLAGCFWDRMALTKPKVPDAPADSFVLRAEGLVPQKPPEPGTPEHDMAGARELFRRGDYDKAERLFHRLAEDKKNPPGMVQEARFMEAESLRLQEMLPKAADTYVRLLNDFPQTSYREQCCQRMFDIANYWLEDTRQEMREAREVSEGKRFFSWHRFVSMDKTKPLLDIQGRAMQKLDQVHFNDRGELGAKALFLTGSVHFFNENYIDADLHFSQIHERHANSPLAPQAVELAIISKHMSTGGPDYDGRKVAEARALVHSALSNYPELAQKKQEFLQNQLAGISNQQAEKDYLVAEFYRRTNHPGSAYFYYKMIEKRYPGTDWAKKSIQRQDELREKVAREGNEQALPVSQPSGPTPPPAGPSKPSGVEVAPPPRPAIP